MAITSELLGKLGGADVEVIPVSATVKSKDPYILYIGEPLPGEKWTVFVVGNMVSKDNSIANLPELSIGDTTSKANSGGAGVMAEVTAGFHVTMKRNFTIDTDSFEGNIYLIKEKI